MTCNVAVAVAALPLPFVLVGSLWLHREHLTRLGAQLSSARPPTQPKRLCVEVCVCGVFSTPVWHITIDLHWISITASCRFAVCFCLRWRWNAGIKLISNDFVPKLSLLAPGFLCHFWFRLTILFFFPWCGKKNWNACRPGRMLLAAVLGSR